MALLQERHYLAHILYAGAGGWQSKCRDNRDVVGGQCPRLTATRYDRLPVRAAPHHPGAFFAVGPSAQFIRLEHVSFILKRIRH